ncbi:MAG TPA: acyltransferase family protein [Azospirillaceae bacterium]|nr:acyltransferase family protein [Azospirillaceae bacterium]
MSTARTYFLDRIRVLLTVLVVAHHTAITYGASGSWFFKEEVPGGPTGDLLTVFTAVNQAFFMGMFFLLAGYFTPASLARKGRASFMRERLVRLGIPVLVFGFLLGPLTVAIARSGSGAGGDWLARLAAGQFVLGPLWFALALLLFSAACLLLPQPSEAPAAKPVPGPAAWAAAALGVGAAALLVRQVVPVGEEVFGLQLGYFASYVFLFFLGCAAAPHRWLERVERRTALGWAAVTALALPALPLALALAGDAPIRFETGFSGPAVLYAFWEPFVAWGLIALLLWGLRERANRPAPLWDALAAQAYGAFILHAPVIVALSVLIAGWAAPPAVKFLLVTTLGSALAFGLTWILRRLPLVRRVI